MEQLGEVCTKTDTLICLIIPQTELEFRLLIPCFPVHPMQVLCAANVDGLMLLNIKVLLCLNSRRGNRKVVGVTLSPSQQEIPDSPRLDVLVNGFSLSDPVDVLVFLFIYKKQFTIIINYD